MNKKLLKLYLNNISDLLLISKEECFKYLLKRITNDKIIVNSHLIHKEKTISHLDNFIFNLDNYISFVKNNLFLNDQEIRYIILLSLNNRYNSILLEKEYYYDNVNKYIKNFKKMFMYQYNNNINKISKFTNTKKKSFVELIKYINNNKKRSYMFFEKINKNNMNFYIDLFQSNNTN